MDFFHSNRKYNIICLVILFLVSIYPCYSQSYQELDTIFVHLEKRDGPGMISFVMPGQMIDGNENYKGIPDSLDYYKIVEFEFQPAQYLYEQLLEGKISNEKYLSDIRKRNLSHKAVSKEKTKNTVGVLSALINGKRIIWCDKDNDKDFSDEVPSIYNLEELKAKKGVDSDSIATITVQYEHFFNGKIYNRYQSIKIIPYHVSYDYEESVKEDLQVYISSDQHQFGYFSDKNKKYKVSVPSGLGGYYYYNDVFIGEANGEFIDFIPWPRIGNTLSINNSVYFLNSLSEFGDTLMILKSKRNNKLFGYREGNYVELEEFKTLKSDALFSPQNINKDYILLDFWGTWCKPCIKQLPTLKELVKTFSKNLETISISYDNDSLKVKEFIKKNEMNWTHKFESSKNPHPNDWVIQFNVDCYPTLILLDKEFKIIVRGCGEDAVGEIKKVLSSP